jgi:hypothetical protein
MKTRLSYFLHRPIDPFSHVDPSVHVAPSKIAPDRFAPDRFAPDRFAPGKYALPTIAPDKFAPDKFAPRRNAPFKYAPLRFAPDRFAPERLAKLRFAPERSHFWQAFVFWTFSTSPELYPYPAWTPCNIIAITKHHTTIAFVFISHPPILFCYP